MKPLHTTKITIIKKGKYKCQQRCRDTGALSISGGDINGANSVEISLADPQKYNVDIT
jgi:hypothetical protein